MTNMSRMQELVARRRAAASVEEPVYEELYREASTIKQRLQRKQAAFQQLQLKVIRRSSSCRLTGPPFKTC